ncbi:MAG: hypothetical protein KDA62_16230, partial [Planctomycetales bacterium]|nr:hypothetical protein [Planctomycetales bacterium]
EFEGIRVYHFDDLPTMVGGKGIRFAILAVPSVAAQTVADQLIAAGIDGILNFAPVTVTVPSNVSIIGVDLAIELEQLSFAVVNRGYNS